MVLSDSIIDTSNPKGSSHSMTGSMWDYMFFGETWSIFQVGIEYFSFHSIPERVLEDTFLGKF
jgi:hypothetical protein